MQPKQIRINYRSNRRNVSLPSETREKNGVLLCGWDARAENLGIDSCPYDNNQMGKRNAWLYGWTECNKKLT